MVAVVVVGFEAFFLTTTPLSVFPGFLAGAAGVVDFGAAGAGAGGGGDLTITFEATALSKFKYNIYELIMN